MGQKLADFDFKIKNDVRISSLCNKFKEFHI